MLLGTLPHSDRYCCRFSKPYCPIGMDMISLEGKTNFFEKRVGEYQKSGVMASLDQSSTGNRGNLNFDADF